MLRETKIEVENNLVLACGRDMKKLYKVINGITSNNLANQIPDTMDDKQLAEEFAEFFMGKIKKICEALDSHPIYESSEIIMHSKIWKFRRLTTREVKNMIMKIQTKSCESDPIRAKLLKATLSKTLPIIAKIMTHP